MSCRKFQFYKPRTWSTVWFTFWYKSCGFPDATSKLSKLVLRNKSRKINQDLDLGRLCVEDTSVLRTLHTYKVWSIVYLESCDATHTQHVRTKGSVDKTSLNAADVSFYTFCVLSHVTSSHVF